MPPRLFSFVNCAGGYSTGAFLDAGYSTGAFLDGGYSTGANCAGGISTIFRYKFTSATQRFQKQLKIYDIKNPIWNKFFKPAISCLKLGWKARFHKKSSKSIKWVWNDRIVSAAIYLKWSYKNSVNDITFETCWSSWDRRTIWKQQQKDHMWSLHWRQKRFNWFHGPSAGSCFIILAVVPHQNSTLRSEGAALIGSTPIRWLL